MSDHQPHPLARLVLNGWRAQVDCGPSVRLVQDRYQPHVATDWLYSTDLMQPRYVAADRFEAVAEALLVVAAGMAERGEVEPYEAPDLD